MTPSYTFHTFLIIQDPTLLGHKWSTKLNCITIIQSICTFQWVLKTNFLLVLKICKKTFLDRVCNPSLLYPQLNNTFWLWFGFNNNITDLSLLKWHYFFRFQKVFKKYLYYNSHGSVSCVFIEVPHCTGYQYPLLTLFNYYFSNINIPCTIVLKCNKSLDISTLTVIGICI